MPIRLIALDLDDTLLREDLSISQGNKNALNEAVSRGVQVVLASGRNVYGMRRYAEELGLDGPGEYMICTNGAEILETSTGRRVYERAIEGELCLEIGAAVRNRGFPYQFYEGGTIWATSPNPWSYEDTRLTGQALAVIDPDKEEALLAEGRIKFVIPGEPESLAALLEDFQSLFAGRAEILISKPYFLEILPYGVDKGEALGHLTALLGVDLSEVIAMGDSMNDIGMIRAAGWGCAPANATDGAKAAARIVSERSNDEDAVADIIGRLL